MFAGTDACVTPVLSWTEAAANEHLLARSTVVDRSTVSTRPHPRRGSPAPRPAPVGNPPKGTTPLDQIGW